MTGTQIKLNMSVPIMFNRIKPLILNEYEILYSRVLRKTARYLLRLCVKFHLYITNKYF